MNERFLDDVINARREALGVAFGDLRPADRERLASVSRPPRDFLGALRAGENLAVIAEVKKRSPSVGAIAPMCEASRQALHYQDGGAAAISVLTEPKFFGGSFADLSDVADAVDIPVLCKDFVVDPVQLFAARGHGADAVLLMVSVLGMDLPEYLDLASTLGMTALVEVHSADELDIALASKATLVGVNSRDLRNLEVTPEKVAPLIARAKAAGVTVVAESGIKVRTDVVAAAANGADAVLVGTALMKSDTPEDEVQRFATVPRYVKP
jgi:indole-3-glycerol phosphate synthase